MTKGVDIEAGAPAPIAAAIAIPRALARARGGTSAARAPARHGLDVRPRGGAAIAAGALPPGLPYAMALSPALLGWVASRLHGEATPAAGPGGAEAGRGAERAAARSSLDDARALRPARVDERGSVPNASVSAPASAAPVEVPLRPPPPGSGPALAPLAQPRVAAIAPAWSLLHAEVVASRPAASASPSPSSAGPSLPRAALPMLELHRRDGASGGPRPAATPFVDGRAIATGMQGDGAIAASMPGDGAAAASMPGGGAAAASMFGSGAAALGGDPFGAQRALTPASDVWSRPRGAPFPAQGRLEAGEPTGAGALEASHAPPRGTATAGDALPLLIPSGIGRAGHPPPSPAATSLPASRDPRALELAVAAGARGAPRDPPSTGDAGAPRRDPALAPLPALVARRAAQPSPLTALGGDELAGTLRRLVEHEVSEQVARLPAPRPAPPPAAGPPAPAIDVTSDAFVRRLMHRIRALAHDERFRGGDLR